MILNFKFKSISLHALRHLELRQFVRVLRIEWWQVHVFPFIHIRNRTFVQVQNKRKTVITAGMNEQFS